MLCIYKNGSIIENMTVGPEATPVDTEQRSDVLALLRNTPVAEQEATRERLRGKNLILTGFSEYKFWLGIDEHKGKVYPDRELFSFLDAQVQVLDVLYGTSSPESSDESGFGLVVEGAVQFDQQRLPRLVLGGEIASLIDPFPGGFEGQDVERIVGSAQTIFHALLEDPQFSRY
jgi:hypothetical protein